MKWILLLALLLPLPASAQGWHPVWVRLSVDTQTPPADTLEVFSRKPGTQTWTFRGAKGPFASGYCAYGCPLTVALVNIPKDEEVMAWLKRGTQTSPMSNIMPPGSYFTTTEIATGSCCAVTQFCCESKDVNADGNVDAYDKLLCSEMLAGRFQ